MSFQYDQYLANHRANVKRGFDWLCENLPHSIEEVMDTKFFDGKSLEDIWDDVADLEY